MYVPEGYLSDEPALVTFVKEETQVETQPDVADRGPVLF